MLSESEKRLRRVLLALMKPIARVLLLSGIKTREAAEILKAAYVLTATHDKGRSDAPASVSHVARVTGLDRREVARLKTKFGPDSNSEHLDPADEAVVLSHWHTDIEYLDSGGKPKPVPMDTGQVSFRALVEKYCPHRDAPQLLDILMERGYVLETPDGFLKPLKRSFSQTKGIDAAILSLEHGVRCLAHTIHHNLHAAEGDSWIQRNVMAEKIARSSVPFARRAIRDRAVEFSFGVDDLLAAATKAVSQDDPTYDGHEMTIGIGLYYFEMDAQGIDTPQDYEPSET